jgi:hypothetical protein
MPSVLSTGVIEKRDEWPTVAMYCHGIHQYFFGGKYNLIQLHRQMIHQNNGIYIHEKLIEIFNTSTFYLKFKENSKNDVTFCYFSCLGWYCFRPTSMAALQLLTLALLV